MCCEKFTRDEIQLLFKLRSRMLDVKSNFQTAHGTLTCRVCEEHQSVENEDHLLNCKLLSTEEKLDNNDKFIDVFGSIKK